MSNNRSGCMWLALGILCISIFANLVLMAALGLKEPAKAGKVSAKQLEPLEERLVEPGKGDSRVALISLRGIISLSDTGRSGARVDWIKRQLQQAADDKSVKAIILAIDSPGGEVTASDILYNAVRRARDRKPVVVSMGSMAASGGYYIACGGSYLMANETTFTGSIGVIIHLLRYNDLLGKIGVVPLTFKSGEFKDMLSGTREMTPQEKEYVQQLVMQTYGKFVGIVSRERKIPEDQLRSGIADGRVISGKDALAAKLINGLGEIEDAYKKARELAQAPDAPVITYRQALSFSSLFHSLGNDATELADRKVGKVEVNLAAEILPQLEPGKAYLLPSYLAP